MSDDVLTLDKLRALAAEIPPTPRIIVGMPIVKEDEGLKRESDGLILLGRVAWERWRQALPSIPDASPFYGRYGIRVEFYGDSPDHRKILLEIFDAIAKGILLRIALDEHFGDTKPLTESFRALPPARRGTP